MASAPLNEATWLELTLITAAVALSILLATLTLPPLAQAGAKSRPLLQSVVLIVLSVATLLHVIISLAVLYERKISLDTFSVSLIGLIPAIQTFPLLNELLIRANAQARMRSREPLRANTSQFRYVRFGRAPDPEKLLHGLTSNARTYIRVPFSTHVAGQFHGDVWHGKVINADDKVVVLRDVHDAGDAIRWWRAAKEAVHLVETPDDALLPSREAVIHALEALVELASIGDVVLKVHGNLIRRHMRGSRGLNDALRATPISACNEILEQTKLSRWWGTVDTEVARDFMDDVQYLDLSRGRKYAVLFFFLLRCSQMFMVVKKVGTNDAKLPSANDVTATFTETANENMRMRIVAQWLLKWNFKEAAIAADA